MNQFRSLALGQQIIALTALIIFISACSGERYTELMSASRDGDNKAVNRILDYGAEIDLKTSKGKTALMLSASNGHTDTVELLIDRGANVNHADVYGTTALIVSATSGRTETSALLAKHGADPLLKDTSGGSALTNAAFFGHTETVKILLDNITSLPKDDGEELLMLAAGLGHLGIAEALFDKRVDANVRGSKGHTAIMAATAFNRPEMVKLLLAKGADPKIKDAEGISAIDVARNKDYQNILTLLQDK